MIHVLILNGTDCSVLSALTAGAIVPVRIAWAAALMMSLWRVRSQLGAVHGPVVLSDTHDEAVPVLGALGARLIDRVEAHGLSQGGLGHLHAELGDRPHVCTALPWSPTLEHQRQPFRRSSVPQWPARSSWRTQSCHMETLVFSEALGVGLAQLDGGEAFLGLLVDLASQLGVGLEELLRPQLVVDGTANSYLSSDHLTATAPASDMKARLEDAQCEHLRVELTQ
jgi:hypothetical protein